MATMATTSHGLSVYVNSCVKTPLQQKTRNSGFLKKEQEMHPPYSSSDHGVNGAPGIELSDSNDEFGRALRSFDEDQDDIETQLKNLTHEQFYLKLQQLKEANRKTLEECELLLKEKYAADNKPLGTLAAKDMVEGMFAARLAERSGHTLRKSNPDGLGDMLNSCQGFSDPTALASKPPPAPHGKRDLNLAKTAPVQSSLLPSYRRRRPLSAPSRDQFPQRAYSLDDDDWQRVIRASSDISDDDDNGLQNDDPIDPELRSAVSRIRDMWHGFKVKTGERRHSHASIAKKKKDEYIGENWRHRITIPQPFQMLQREAMKAKKKTKAQKEVEEKLLEKKRQEEEECQKKFKAQPAPAHIYLPLYDEICEKNEARRRHVKQYCNEMLKSQEKPFNFMKREQEKKQQRARSATVAERIARSVELAKKQETKFVARPVPDFVTDPEPRDRQLEEEEYRKIRIKLRARELLKQSALPPNMAAVQQMKEQKEKERLIEEQKKKQKRKHKRSHQVPDYDFLYHEFQKELARRKEMKEATVVEPFDLNTSSLRSSRDRVLRDMERETARTTHRASLGYLSSSMDAIPSRSTAAADLRSDFYRSQQEREKRKEELREEEDRRRRLREVKMRKYIVEHSDHLPRNIDLEVKKRLQKHREADSSRLEAYEKELDEMKEKVSKRPLLFEREMQLNAEKAAERRFKSTLKNAGVDEEFVSRQARLARSTEHSGDEDEDRRDLTFSRHREMVEA